MPSTRAEVNHKIKISLSQNVQSAIPTDIRVGQTVQYSSDDGEVRIRYTKDWPFDGEKHDIKSGEVLTLQKPGDFKFQCFITPQGKSEIGWKNSGGEIKPRT